ncbi:MAG: hypothetical protein RIA64_01480 [Rhodospirillales bacterium]
MDYDGLKAVLKGYLSDDYTDFDDLIDEIVVNAEKRISRDLNLPAQTTWLTGSTLTQGTNTLDLPSTSTGVIHWISITKSDGTQVILKRRETSYLRDYAPDPTSTGQPVYYAIYDADTILLAPTPDYQTGTTDYPYTLVHEVRITGLTVSGATTTWLSENAEDLLLQACLVEGAMIHKDFGGEDGGGLKVYEAEYKIRLDSQRAEVARVMRDQTNTHQ